LKCDFCEFRCTIPEGKRGRCGIRYRDGDKIKTVNYGEHVSLAVDPIEKKPLYHFYPGQQALSSALFGCNFTCSFCQNCTISQRKYFGNLRTRYIGPSELADETQAGGYPIVAFTYSEPSIWQDYVIDAAREIKKVGGKSVMVTNGYFTEESIGRLTPWISAFNIDLKGGEEFYKKLCGGHVGPVLRNIATIASMQNGPVLEVTTMLLEGSHTEEEIMELAHGIDEAGVKVWHLSAFRPASQMSDRAPTSQEFLHRIYDRAKAETSIPHLYAFSRTRREFSNTYCEKCGELLIDRFGFSVNHVKLSGRECPSCGHELYGAF